MVNRTVEYITWNTLPGIQNPKLSWIPSHGAILIVLRKEMLETALGSSGRRIRAPSIPVHIYHPLKQTTGNSFVVLIFQTGPLLFRIQLM